MDGNEAMKKLQEKAKKEWKKNWRQCDMEYDSGSNTITVWVDEPDVRKAFFNADTLVCIGTKV